MKEREDTHFLIDSARPREVEYALRGLDAELARTVEDLRERMLVDWGFQAQKNLSLSTRRLSDLGLALRRVTSAGKPGYVLSPLGSKARGLLDTDRDLYADVLHYLHYDGYDGTPASRKLFWSYKCCCDIVWARKRVPPTSELVADIQARIAEEFPLAYSQKRGGNFNAGGVNAWKVWLADLCDPPISAGSNHVTPRTRSSFELVLLALDHVYRARRYRYGDPVILDDALLDELARVFFLEHVCVRELLGLAAKLSKAVGLRDTFAGTSVSLRAPYTVEDI